MKRIISVILAAMMLLMIAPTAAHGKRAESRAPYGYVEHEYDQLLAFMEQTNSAGVKNGTQLSSAYDPNDPETWGGIFWYIAPTGFIHAEYIFFSTYDFPNRNLVGTLNLSGFSKLRAFGCAGNSITAVSISDCPLLDELNVAQNLLTNFSVSNCAELRLVWCEENMLPSVSMSNLPKLRQFHCYQNPITELDVSPFENLRYLFCGNTGISQIDVSRNPQLRELRCENTHLTSIDVSKCENLTDLFCNNTDISELDISNNPALVRLFCNNTDISVLDLSQNTNIDKLRCYDAKLMSLEWKCIIPGLSLDITLLSEGDGYVGVDWERVYVSDNYWENRITAVATPNGTFRGWYMGESLVSSSLRLPLGADIDIPATMLTAKFDGTTPIPPTPTPPVSPEPPTPTPPVSPEPPTPTPPRHRRTSLPYTASGFWSAYRTIRSSIRTGIPGRALTPILRKKSLCTAVCLPKRGADIQASLLLLPIMTDTFTGIRGIITFSRCDLTIWSPGKQRSSTFSIPISHRTVDSMFSIWNMTTVGTKCSPSCKTAAMGHSAYAKSILKPAIC